MTVKLSCTLTATGTTAATGTNLGSLNQGPFTIVASGAGTVTLEFLPPGGATWLSASTASTGTPNSFVVAAATPVGVVGYCVDAAFQWRFNCTAYTSTLTCLLTQGGEVLT